MLPPTSVPAFRAPNPAPSVKPRRLRGGLARVNLVSSTQVPFTGSPEEARRSRKASRRCCGTPAVLASYPTGIYDGNATFETYAPALGQILLRQAGQSPVRDIDLELSCVNIVT